MSAFNPDQLTQDNKETEEKLKGNTQKLAGVEKALNAPQDQSTAETLSNIKLNETGLPESGEVSDAEKLDKIVKELREKHKVKEDYRDTIETTTGKGRQRKMRKKLEDMEREYTDLYAEYEALKAKVEGTGPAEQGATSTKGKAVAEESPEGEPGILTADEVSELKKILVETGWDSKEDLTGAQIGNTLLAALEQYDEKDYKSFKQAQQKGKVPKKMEYEGNEGKYLSKKDREKVEKIKTALNKVKFPDPNSDEKRLDAEIDEIFEKAFKEADAAAAAAEKVETDKEKAAAEQKAKDDAEKKRIEDEKAAADKELRDKEEDKKRKEAEGTKTAADPREAKRAELQTKWEAFKALRDEVRGKQSRGEHVEDADFVRGTELKKEIADLNRELSGKELRELAMEEARKMEDGGEVTFMRTKEYKKVLEGKAERELAKEEKNVEKQVRQQRQIDAVEKVISGLPEEEQEEIRAKCQNEDGDLDPKRCETELKVMILGINRELGRHGMELTQDEFCEMVSQGYDPRGIKGSILTNEEGKMVVTGISGFVTAASIPLMAGLGLAGGGVLGVMAGCTVGLYKLGQKLFPKRIYGGMKIPSETDPSATYTQEEAEEFFVRIADQAKNSVDTETKRQMEILRRRKQREIADKVKKGQEKFDDIVVKCTEKVVTRPLPENPTKKASPETETSQTFEDFIKELEPENQEIIKLARDKVREILEEDDFDKEELNKAIKTNKGKNKFPLYSIADPVLRGKISKLFAAEVKDAVKEKEAELQEESRLEFIAKLESKEGVGERIEISPEAFNVMLKKGWEPDTLRVGLINGAYVLHINKKGRAVKPISLETFKKEVDEFQSKADEGKEKIEADPKKADEVVEPVREDAEPISSAMTDTAILTDTLIPEDSSAPSKGERKGERGVFEAKEKNIANQDSHPNRSEDAVYFDPQGKSGGVFDGLGGHYAAAEASQFGARFIEKALAGIPQGLSEPQVKEAIVGIMKDAGKAVKDRAVALVEEQFENAKKDRESYKDIVSLTYDEDRLERYKDLTIENVRAERKLPSTTAAIFKAYEFVEQGKKVEKVFVCSIGDSPVYHWHEASKSLEMVTKLERSGVYNVDQCLGADGDDINPRVHTLNIENGDKMLLMTDGIYDNFSSEESDPEIARKRLEEILSANNGDPIEEIAREAEAGWKSDDRSILIVELKK